MFKGSYVALVTPMTPEGDIDYVAYKNLIEWHLEQHTDGFVVLGTTGESPTITAPERLKLVQTALSVVNKAKPVIIGTGANSTQHAIELTQQAAELGADAALIVTPYYNKPTQEGLFLHYEAIAKAVAIPQILYNVPSRTGCDLQPAIAKRLAKLPNIVAIKETVTDTARYDYLVNEAHLALLSGNDADNLAMLKAGACGFISVVANVIPKQCHQLYQCIVDQDIQAADALDQRLQPLYEALFVETNPIPTKWALQQMGRIQRGIRLPLTWLTRENESVVKNALTNEEITCAI